jgi:hypothetical protein
LQTSTDPPGKHCIPKPHPQHEVYHAAMVGSRTRVMYPLMLPSSALVTLVKIAYMHNGLSHTQDVVNTGETAADLDTR